MFIVPKDDKLIAEVKVKPEDINLLNKEFYFKARIEIPESEIEKLKKKLN